MSDRQCARLLAFLLAIDALAFPLLGSLLAWMLWGMMEYGSPQPSAEAVLLEYVATFVLAPVLVLLAIGWAGSLILYRNPPVAFMLAAVPIPLSPIFLWHAIA